MMMIDENFRLHYIIFSFFSLSMIVSYRYIENNIWYCDWQCIKPYVIAVTPIHFATTSLIIVFRILSKLFIYFTRPIICLPSRYCRFHSVICDHLSYLFHCMYVILGNYSWYHLTFCMSTCHSFKNSPHTTHHPLSNCFYIDNCSMSLDRTSRPKSDSIWFNSFKSKCRTMLKPVSFN